GDGRTVRTVGDGEEAAVDRRAAEQLHVAGVVGVELLLLLFAAPGLAFDGEDIRGHLGVEIVVVEIDLPLAVERAHGGELLAVRRKGDAIDAAFHGRPFANAERIVADAALHLADDAIGLRDAIRAADEEFIALRVPRDALQTAAERAGGDG